MDNFISKEWAEIICIMEGICSFEGVGPDSTEIIQWIFDNYPDLKEKYQSSLDYPCNLEGK